MNKTHGQLTALLLRTKEALAVARGKLRKQNSAAAAAKKLRISLAKRDAEIAALKDDLADRREQVRVLARRLKKEEAGR